MRATFLSLTLTLAAAGPAHASKAGLEAFTAWAEKMISKKGRSQGADNIMATFNGTTPEGKKCALFVTRKMAPDYYLSLGVGPSLETDDLNENMYIGGFINEFTAISVTDSRIDYEVTDQEIIGGEADDPKSVRSQRILRVDLDRDGNPVHVTGVSSRQAGRVECDLAQTP